VTDIQQPGNNTAPTQIGSLTAITSPKWWVVVAVFSAIGFAAITWSIVGEIYITVTGLGVVVPVEGKITTVPARTGGRVKRVAVNLNDHVEAGDLIAEIHQPLLRAKYEAATELIRVLTAQRAKEARQNEESLRRREALAEGQIAAQNARLASLTEAGQFRARVLADMEDEFAQGFATRTQLEQARGEKITNDLNLRDAQTQVQNIRAQLEQERTSSQRSLFSLDQEILKAEQNAADILQNLTQSERVVAPLAGRVASIATATGKLVPAEYPVAIIEPEAQDVTVAAYFQIADGKRIEKGAQVRVKVGSIDSDVFGTALGTVDEVAELPSTAESIKNLVENETFVTQMQRAGAPLRVMIKLTPAEGQPGHLMMSSGKPSPTPVTVGTTASAQVLVQRVAPISYVINLAR